MTYPLITKFTRLVELNPEDSHALRALTGRACRYPACKDLVREGGSADCVIIVIEGWACRYKVMVNGSRQILAFLMPGDVADLQGSILTRMDHSIQTLTRAKIAIIPRDEMSRVLREHPTLARAMTVTQIIDEGTMRAWIANVGRRTSIERIAYLFCELHLRAQRAGLSVGNRTAIPLSQGAVADALGITPVHCNRVLRALREKGVLLVEKGFSEFLDLPRLQSICDFRGTYLESRD